MARATAFFLILLACGASLLAVAAPAEAAKPKPCWKQVLDDWSDNGSIDGKYPSRCIDEAIAKAPEDVRAYTDFEELAELARQDRTLYGGGGTGDPTETVPGSENNPIVEREPDTGPKDETPVGWVLGTNGNNADSVPIPLLVLLGLATALITAGGAGFAARKLQAHRAKR